MKLATKPIVEEYVLQLDRKSPKPTVFTLRSLDADEFVRLGELQSIHEQDTEILMIAASAAHREPTEYELQRVGELVCRDRTRLLNLRAVFEFLVTTALLRTKGLQSVDGQAMDDIGAEDFARYAPFDVLLELGARVLQMSMVVDRAGARHSPTIH